MPQAEQPQDPAGVQAQQDSQADLQTGGTAADPTGESQADPAGKLQVEPQAEPQKEYVFPTAGVFTYKPEAAQEPVVNVEPAVQADPTAQDEPASETDPYAETVPDAEPDPYAETDPYIEGDPAAAPSIDPTPALRTLSPVEHRMFVNLAGLRVQLAARALYPAVMQAYCDRYVPIANPVDFAELRRTNLDIVAWVSVPGTYVDRPICMSTTDDAFYLTHNEGGDYTLYGVPFMQLCNDRDFTDPVTVVYGHNVHVDEYEFTSLHYFENYDFFQSHDVLYVYTPGHILTYRVVSAYMYDDRHILNSFDFSNPEVLAAYQAYVCSPDSLVCNVREGVQLTSRSKILQLSTCMTEPEYSGCRYLVTGVLVRDQATF